MISHHAAHAISAFATSGGRWVSAAFMCDPRRPDGKVVLNSRVKHREAFRAFAPVVLLEEASNWFEWDGVEI